MALSDLEQVAYADDVAHLLVAVGQRDHQVQELQAICQGPFRAGLELLEQQVELLLGQAARQVPQHGVHIVLHSLEGVHLSAPFRQPSSPQQYLELTSPQA